MNYEKSEFKYKNLNWAIIISALVDIVLVIYLAHLTQQANKFYIRLNELETKLLIGTILTLPTQDGKGQEKIPVSYALINLAQSVEKISQRLTKLENNLINGSP